MDGGNGMEMGTGTGTTMGTGMGMGMDDGGSNGDMTMGDHMGRKDVLVPVADEIKTPEQVATKDPVLAQGIQTVCSSKEVQGKIKVLNPSEMPAKSVTLLDLIQKQKDPTEHLQYVHLLKGMKLEQEWKEHQLQQHVQPHLSCVFETNVVKGVTPMDLKTCQAYLEKMRDFRERKVYNSGGEWLSDYVHGQNENDLVNFHLHPQHKTLKFMKEPKTFHVLFDIHTSLEQTKIYSENVHSVDQFISSMDLRPILDKLEQWGDFCDFKLEPLSPDHHSVLFKVNQVRVAKFRNTSPFDLVVEPTSMAQQSGITKEQSWSSAAHSTAFTSVPGQAEETAKSDVVAYAEVLSGHTPALTEPRRSLLLFDETLDTCMLSRLTKWAYIDHPEKELEQGLERGHWKRVDGRSDVRAIPYQTEGSRFMTSPNMIQLYLAEQIKYLSAFEGKDQVFAPAPEDRRFPSEWRSGEPEPDSIKRVRESIYLTKEDEHEPNVIWVYTAQFTKRFVQFINKEVARSKHLMEFVKHKHSLGAALHPVKLFHSLPFFNTLKQEELNRRKGFRKAELDDYFKPFHITVELAFTGHIAAFVQSDSE